MLDAKYLAGKFEAGVSYAQYVATGTEEQRRRWEQVYAAAQLNADQQALVAGFTRRMHVLVSSGIWCGDCVQQCPLMERIAEGNPDRVVLRFVDRDQHKDLAEKVRMNMGDRVPTVIFMAEDFEFCALAGDRVLARYRAIAQRQLGAACPVAIGPMESGEMEATVADWVREFERVHLMLRLSGRLRKKHGD